MREKQTETVEKIVYTCDKCGWKSTDLENSKFIRRFHTCSICGGDFCGNCGIETEYRNFIRGEIDGDYADYWICDSCWKIGKPFFEQNKKDLEKFEEIIEKHHKNKKNWINKWKEKVKNG